MNAECGMMNPVTAKALEHQRLSEVSPFGVTNSLFIIPRSSFLLILHPSSLILH